MSNHDTTQLLRALVIERATELARSGEFEEAIQALTELRATEEEDPVILDLLARIQAQQGRYPDAEVCWREAARLDPANPDYQAGLQKLAQLRTRPYLPASLFPLVLGISFIGLLVLGAVVIGVRSSPSSTIKNMDPPEASGPPQERSPAPTLAVPVSPHPSDLHLAVPGVIVQSDGDAIVATFGQGIFGTGSRLTPEGERMLAAMAKQLAPEAKRLTIQIVGHTNDIPVPASASVSDNVDLGWRRAVVVANTMRQAAGLPTTMFSVSSQGEANPPYQNDGPDNRIKNRTVVLRVSQQVP